MREKRLDPEQEVSIAYTSEFRRNLKALGKRYPDIRKDLKPFIPDYALGRFYTAEQ